MSHIFMQKKNLTKKSYNLNCLKSNSFLNHNHTLFYEPAPTFQSSKQGKLFENATQSSKPTHKQDVAPWL